ncbi:hypothetical protein LEP1GSC115_3194 [Leptospira interrogans serovar Australis str. 200703203]|uniref:Uncharacterized protein n=1 Tax=Leptospira interrogans serovar Australis str. 200703203 TaxID=1085541 RepID=N1USF2_LEPIR|nr:hypothetical protein LEP1GSC115_3194 [Leptospira interrogans serovar Australis str. 200703203]
MKIVGTTIKSKKSPSNEFFTQNRCFATIIKIENLFFNVSSVEKEFFKSMSSYNFRIDS